MFLGDQMEDKEIVALTRFFMVSAEQNSYSRVQKAKLEAGVDIEPVESTISVREFIDLLTTEVRLEDVGDDVSNIFCSARFDGMQRVDLP